VGIYAKHFFPRLLDWGLGTRLVRKERRIALQEATGRTLEIGFGTGLNLQCYPESVTGLVALDNENMLPDRVAARIAEAKMPVEQVTLDASGKLPFEDESFDTVVTTFTLCSIANVHAALVEMQRVLNRSGKFLFLEHGRSDNASVSRWQDRLNPVQKVIGRGCNMNRAIDEVVSGSGFRIARLERFVMRDTPRIFGSMYRGSASR
jgi:ubiquinone/menaquinone biosynthesis C-methylase UbiE